MDVIKGLIERSESIADLAARNHDDAISAIQQQAAGTPALISIALSLQAIATMMYEERGGTDAAT